MDDLLSEVALTTSGSDNSRSRDVRALGSALVLSMMLVMMHSHCPTHVLRQRVRTYVLAPRCSGSGGSSPQWSPTLASIFSTFTFAR